MTSNFLFKFPLQMPLAEVLVVQVGIGDVALIQRVALPADGVRIRPRHPDTEPRNGRRMRRRGGSRAKTREIETQARGSLPERGFQPRLRRENPRTAGIFHAVGGKRLFGNVELESSEPEARLEQAFLTRVLEHEQRS